ncbi:MAG TPA: hypothetical protein VE983_03350 [Solirubrobacteraceae bacterium]|nr:hypothetical protein [Solirubrobacteraceae bacterium]
MRDRESLIARIRQIRRDAQPVATPDSAAATTEPDLIHALEERIDHLEHMVQGLQDSMHRETTRHGKRIAELEARVEPAEMSRSLSQDARQRGL